MSNILHSEAIIIHKHSPIIEHGGIGTERPCTICPALSDEDLEIFQEVKKIIELPEGEGPVEQIRELFSEVSLSRPKYLKMLNLHNPSEECDTLLHIAADRSYYEVMEILLEAGADPNTTNRKNQLPLHNVVDEGDGCHCPNCNERNAKCVKLLLKFGSHLDVQDWEGDTPLACSALTLMDDCARVLWDAGASIHIKGDVNGRVGKLVAGYIPKEVGVWLDNSIQQDERDRLHLHLDFGSILGGVQTDDHNSLKETKFLVYMSNTHKKAKETLLLHPLVQAYLHLKWKAVGKLFIMLRLCYLAMAILYTYFITFFFLHRCPHPQSKKEVPNSTEEEQDCHPTASTTVMSVVLMAFVLCMIMNEVYEIFQERQKYFWNRLSWCWWAMIATVTINVVHVYEPSPAEWQYIIAAFGVVLAWGMFMFQLARDPKIGIYVEMLGSIVTEFLVFSATYISLIIGFVFGFAVLFPHHPMFQRAYNFLPFVKALLMMAGNTDYEMLLQEEENPRTSDLAYAIGAHLIFVGFLVIATILLMNLLLGLAISDVQKLRSRALLSQTERLILQIDLLETLFQKAWMPLWLRDFHHKHFSIQSQCDAQNFTMPPAPKGNRGVDLTDRWIFSKGNQLDGTAEAESRKRKEGRPIKRIGPVLTNLQPLRRGETRLSESLKEELIRFVNKDGCSKMLGNENET